MNDNYPQFRVATQDDALQIQQLVQSAFRAEDSRPNWTADMDLSSRFRIQVGGILEKIAKSDSAILIATDQSGALVASVGIQKQTAELARLSLLAVDQRHQRGGLGRQVLARAEGYCQRIWGARRTGLNALSTREELILWYMRCGYRKTGQLTHERIQNGLFTDDLCFVEMEKGLKEA
ncbi:GNAT family N-acetyltransferase [Aspergillus clavatus NRRL 1]|uniref:GNAT family acetyltransferase, putative n=1 Tax=Aspergillus clavatus (strain ATCC 1007 / CBS 513.65 / DSM 816 / NCTC 3887 / NRRL 1 / QM 1276 / 107) TaxID=344612 RepID=A1CD21_ASPCL|nr:GNAT family acetyltransferase, putative [Aspergillus clavatus NRRL 1]EAW12428.1 GNAT family acetyltransferase, putative [Aspergillus clavatus NRRL 1]